MDVVPGWDWTDAPVMGLETLDTAALVPAVGAQPQAPEPAMWGRGQGGHTSTGGTDKDTKWKVFLCHLSSEVSLVPASEHGVTLLGTAY